MSELLVKLCNARWRGEQHSHRGVSGNQLPLSRGSGLATREWQHATHAHVPGLWPFDSHIINSSSRHAGLPVAVALMRGRPSQRLVNRASVIRQLDGQLTWPALELPLNPQLKVAPVQVSRKTWKPPPGPPPAPFLYICVVFSPCCNAILWTLWSLQCGTILCKVYSWRNGQISDSLDNAAGSGSGRLNYSSNCVSLKENIRWDAINHEWPMRSQTSSLVAVVWTSSCAARMTSERRHSPGHQNADGLNKIISWLLY